MSVVRYEQEWPQSLASANFLYRKKQAEESSPTQLLLAHSTFAFKEIGQQSTALLC
jgi:hypothetical protein